MIAPLQEAVAYATFANGGTRYAPEVAAGVVSPDGTVISKVAPEGHRARGPVAHQLPGDARRLRGGRQRPERDRLWELRGAGWNEAAFTLGGKTGTASVNGQEPTSWFVGFGPNPNPQYVVVSEINEGGYGAQASAPVVRKIFDYLAAHPVAAPALPPASASVNSSGAAPLPTTTTTTTPGSTTTTAPGSTTTTPAPGSTTTTPGSTTTPSTGAGSTTTTTAPAPGTNAAYRRRSP